jgi:hypothetical protein
MHYFSNFPIHYVKHIVCSFSSFNHRHIFVGVLFLIYNENTFKPF